MNRPSRIVWSGFIAAAITISIGKMASSGADATAASPAIQKPLLPKVQISLADQSQPIPSVLSIALTNLIDQAMLDVWTGATVPAPTDSDGGDGTLAIICYSGPAYVLTGDGAVECSHDLSNWFAFPSDRLQLVLTPDSQFLSPITGALQFFRISPQ